LVEYRLDDLARESGVSIRNIRAYRERGLLDPPRRAGRSAYYDDYHLAQLETISQLLRKGFTSAHIAEFFASMREGSDLADILGLQQAVLGLRSDQPAGQTGPRVVGVDPDSDEGRRLLELGLTEIRDGRLACVDRTVGEIVARVADNPHQIKMILRVYEATLPIIEQLATAVTKTVGECVDERYGPRYLPAPDEAAEIGLELRLYRDLAKDVVTGLLQQALNQKILEAMIDYTADIAVSGRWEPKEA
jgi:DNA-binding transcriptional MerR regulator